MKNYIYTNVLSVLLIAGIIYSYSIFRKSIDELIENSNLDKDKLHSINSKCIKAERILIIVSVLTYFF